MLKLYDFTISGHAHRARLFMSLLGLEYNLSPVDMMKGEHKGDPYLGLNPFGQVPVLDDDGVILRDSTAILVYLARKYGDKSWLPEDPKEAADVQAWLAVASKEIRDWVAGARNVVVFGMESDHDDLKAKSCDLLAIFEGHLNGRDWLVSDHPTIADVACYTYIAHAPEGDVALDDYPAVRAWLENVEALPGFVPMPKSSPAKAA